MSVATSKRQLSKQRSSCLKITKNSVKEKGELMENCIDQKLLNEFCTISASNKNLVGQISKIYEDKFAVNIISSFTPQELILKDTVELRVETLDNEIYFYVALIESQHLLAESQIFFLKPLSALHENNKRTNKRLKIDTFLKSLNFYYRDFPPKESQWQKGRLLDISKGGVKFISREFYSKNQLLEAKLGQPFLERLEYIVGRVTHHHKEDSEYIISLQFINTSKKNQQELDEYINKALELIKASKSKS